jgi:hypothetical protein
MMDAGITPRRQAIAKLGQSREEIRQLLDPPAPPPGEEGSASAAGNGFPRSRIMRALMSSQGLGTVGALAGGLLIARPALALRLLRLVPASTVGKVLIARLISYWRGRPPS